MKIGNISQHVLKRSVLKPLPKVVEPVCIQPTIQECCTGVTLGDGRAMLTSSATVYGSEKDICVYGIAKVVNQIAAQGGAIIGVDIIIQLPEYAYESRLKSMVEHVVKHCEIHGIQVMGIKAYVNAQIETTLFYVNGIGETKESRMLDATKIQPDRDIVLLNEIGTEGALRILFQHEEELKQRFSPSFFRRFVEKKENLIARTEIDIAISQNAEGIYLIGDGGIFASLWNLGEMAEIGVEVDWKKISIKQETIEICERFAVNPYQLTSTGSVLVVVEDGEALVRACAEKDILGSVIGKTTHGCERAIKNGEEKRFLEKPAQDELYRIIGANQSI